MPGSRGLSIGAAAAAAPGLAQQQFGLQPGVQMPSQLLEQLTAQQAGLQPVDALQFPQQALQQQLPQQHEQQQAAPPQELHEQQQQQQHETQQQQHEQRQVAAPQGLHEQQQQQQPAGGLVDDDMNITVDVEQLRDGVAN